ncbi:MAG: hypothetical protein PVJ09_04180 [Candidatus Woesebacteria bacterium]|jgi:hypothetical protein
MSEIETIQEPQNYQEAKEFLINSSHPRTHAGKDTRIALLNKVYEGERETVYAKMLQQYLKKAFEDRRRGTIFHLLEFPETRRLMLIKADKDRFPREMYAEEVKIFPSELLPFFRNYLERIESYCQDLDPNTERDAEVKTRVEELLLAILNKQIPDTNFTLYKFLFDHFRRSDTSLDETKGVIYDYISLPLSNLILEIKSHAEDRKYQMAKRARIISEDQFRRIKTWEDADRQKGLLRARQARLR